jgi:hypothetical protein
MSSLDDDLGDWAEPVNDDEAEALTADMATILAGRTVVPAAIMWWRTRRERRAGMESTPSRTNERTRPPRWYEL